MAQIPLGSIMPKFDDREKVDKSGKERQGDAGTKEPKGEQTQPEENPSVQPQTKGKEEAQTPDNNEGEGIDGPSFGDGEQPSADQKSEKRTQDAPTDSSKQEEGDSEESASGDGQLDLGNLQPADKSESSEPDYSEVEKKIFAELFGEDETVDSVEAAKERIKKYKDAQAEVRFPDIGEFGKIEYVARQEATAKGEDPDEAAKQAYQNFFAINPENATDESIVRGYIYDNDPELQRLYQEGKSEEALELMESSLEEFNNLPRLERMSKIRQTRDQYVKDYQHHKSEMLKKYDELVKDRVAPAVKDAAEGTISALKELSVPRESIEFEGFRLNNPDLLANKMSKLLGSGDPYKLVVDLLGDPKKDPEGFVNKLLDVKLRHSPELNEWRQKHKDKLSRRERELKKKALEEMALSDVEHSRGRGNSSSKAKTTGTKPASPPQKGSVKKKVSGLNGLGLLPKGGN